MIFTDLSDQGMVQILDQVNGRTNSDQQTIEKDWWVMQVLRVLFSRFSVANLVCPVPEKVGLIAIFCTIQEKSPMPKRISPKYLHISEKSCTFAPNFQEKVLK